ncbi:uncharacterized protein LOC111704546 isoform X2 [Eurytemora carolleeae]|uniref:uncharacterized protein LOC111704546 isoform X2 n=1 Tax=Eurytemora carolleeae TaxID=1294199 RepID=UPI000C7590E5|nr:uncharacterized protein LOC111704546 isoform X2 [Eurytemora carolleeae]|eukprot:XP_023332579.1 uncharacterized protein LOC111704546 isoform X2 [Eurytemora affinis]
MFLGGMFKMTLGRFSLVLLLLMMMVMRSNGKGSASNSIRELAKAAILKSWPFGDKQVMADLISEYEVFANSLDFDDCGKKFLCQMSGKKSEDLEWDEEMMVTAYTQPLNYSSPSVQFTVATQVGKSSVGNCDAVYSNCLLTQEMITSPGIAVSTFCGEVRKMM